MTRFRSALASTLLLAMAAVASGQDYVFEGPWHTTNRKLDGIMTCEVNDLGDDQWQGRFHGVWQGVPFDYTVKFDGPPAKLRGKAQIDGADYEWTGSMTREATAESPGRFKGSFGGTRYTGYFDLKEKN